MQRIKRHLLLSVPVQSTAVNTIQLPDTRVLDGKEITGISVYRVGDMPIDVNGSPLVNDVVFRKSFLSLKDKQGVTDIERVPLIALNKIMNFGELDTIVTRQFDISQCLITVGNTVGLVLNEVFVFSIYYLDPKSDC